ncbi:MAG: Gfo/Idh/MocA family oxidoreductase [Bacteroidetes bacterium]|nr:Gfo/Idh/MocA family oxidoreductase [Bacteroidota bacterium]
MGLGKIARTFAADLQLSDDAVLYGAASRDLTKAKAFSKHHQSIKYYGSYKELAMDPDIDVIYVATPHPFHVENTLLCLEHGKAVLCEKPMGMDAREVKMMIDKAKSKQLFLMEGMWTRFIPATEKLLELIDEDAIGEVLFIRADFGFKGDGNPASRIYNKQLGGGSLLDIGIYPIYLSLLTLGIPKEINAMARMTETGVDSYCAMLFGYENSARAILESTVEADTPIEAYIYGKMGHIQLHSRFHHSQKISLFKDGQHTEVIKIPYTGNGYVHEIEEVNRCLYNGYTESKKLPHAISLELIKLMDRVKEQIGLFYGNL